MSGCFQEIVGSHDIDLKQLVSSLASGEQSTEVVDCIDVSRRPFQAGTFSRITFDQTNARIPGALFVRVILRDQGDHFSAPPEKLANEMTTDATRCPRDGDLYSSPPSHDSISRSSSCVHGSPSPSARSSHPL